MDRDGTICKDYDDNMWSDIKHPEMIPGVIDFMRNLLRSGFKIIIITNQYLINEGIITPDDYNSFTVELMNILSSNSIQVLNIYYCPHKRSDSCGCAKPKTGLIEKALRDNQDIDLNNSIFIGNSPEDKLAANSAKVKFYGIDIDNDESRSGFFCDYSQVKSKLIEEGIINE